MKKAIIGFLGAVTLGLGAIAIYAALQPPAFRVERSKLIAAPVDAVFAQVGDLRNWQKWSPWAGRDPNMKIEFGESSTGVGGLSRWKSEKEGAGSQTITAFEPNRRIDLKLEFTEPFEDWAAVSWTFKETPQGTEATWSMDAFKETFMEKFFFAMFSLESQVAKDFEAGLSNLAKIFEEQVESLTPDLAEPVSDSAD